MDDQLSLLQAEKEDMASLLEEEAAKQDKVTVCTCTPWLYYANYTY